MIRRVCTIAVALVVFLVAGQQLAAFASFTRVASATRIDATGILSAPSNPNCSVILPTSASIRWTAPTGVTTPSLLRYTIKRATDGSSTYTTLVANQTGTSYLATSPGNGKYDYVITASYLNWTSPNSVILNIQYSVSKFSCV